MTFCSHVHQVRREKISERMKLLQDLVPGCNKVLKLDVIHGVNLIEFLEQGE